MSEDDVLYSEVGGVVCEEFLNQRGKNGVEVGRDELGGAEAGRDNGLTKAVRFMDLGYGPLGLVHVDAHADTGDIVLGEKICHGTPFRRCVEEGLLDCKRVVQIGLRGSTYEPDGYLWSKEQGFRVVTGEDCWLRSLAPLMKEVRQQMGNGPVYISFDIDGLDPAFAPGTGTPEIAGLQPSQ
eukprot:g46348.t1